MSDAHSKSPRASRARPILIEVCFVLACAFYAQYFATIRMDRLMWEPATFEKMVAGTALTPFQYRVLIPWTVDLLRSTFGLARIPLDHFRFGSEFLFTFLLFITFRNYINSFIHNRLRSAVSVLLLAWALPFHYILPATEQLGLYYAYDIPSVFFFALGLLLLYKRRWPLFYAVFLLATFNRETTCFLTLIYLLTSFSRDWLPGWMGKCSESESTNQQMFESTDVRINESSNQRLAAVAPLVLRSSKSGAGSAKEGIIVPVAAHCFAQLALWCLVKGSLSALYGGSFHYVHYTRNFYLLRVPSTYPLMLSVFGFTWVPVLLGLQGIRNDFVRRSCYAVPIFFAGMFIVAQIYELRLYGEMIPVVLAAFVIILEKAVKRVVGRQE